MEVIELSSYTDEEKLQIAKRTTCCPSRCSGTASRRPAARQRRRHPGDYHLLHPGVRRPEPGARAGDPVPPVRYALCGRKVPQAAERHRSQFGEFLGVRKFLPDPLPPSDPVGLVTGLAWTSVGGETLEVEVNVVDGTGKLELTGNLGDVMKESVYAAMSYIRSRAEILKLPADFYKTKDIHVHFPKGAIPRTALPPVSHLYGHGLGPDGPAGPRDDRHDRRDFHSGAGCCPSAASRRRPWRPCATASRPSSSPRPTPRTWRRSTRPSARRLNFLTRVPCGRRAPGRPGVPPARGIRRAQPGAPGGPAGRGREQGIERKTGISQ